MNVVRLATHVRSSTPSANDETTNLKQAIGGRDGDRADAKGGDKLSNRRETLTGRPGSGVEGSFDRGGDFCRIRALDSIS